jgi:Domain of unknown function (DUF1996)
MNLKTHKRSRSASTKIAAGATALILGGGGLVAFNFYASADQSTNDAQEGGQQTVSTIKCPDVGNALRNVPDSARDEVSRNLALLDTQSSKAYSRMRSSQREMADDGNYLNNAIMGPLKSKRTAAINRITTAISRSGEKPQGLEDLAECEVQRGIAPPAFSRRPQGNNGQDNNGRDNNGRDNNDQDNNGQDNNGQGNDGQDNDGQGNGQPAGPAQEDFVDITQVQPNFTPVDTNGQGVFKTECGTNSNDNHNSDNIIVAPGVDNGAQHTHDYVGNQDNDGFSSDEDLANAETSCANQEDKSTYYWPVLRVQNGQDEFDANQPGGGEDGNIGQILEPTEAELTFEGNPQSEVTEMPRFLRIISGDAKAFTNGDANANASWSCTGFEDRQLADKYPVCPDNSQVVRTVRFQSCWDGQNIDSANHRDHVAFTNEDGSCDNGFQAIPQMIQRIVYDVPDGETFAVDGFPEELHKPITDHGDFINVMSDDLNQRVVECINNGENCVNQ